ncbi:hypothetical protein BJY04DRAFT_155690 [Aspergillus karnatakaensis]|uniref:uncharacterized protein n=1 Tax=Aspergillus karnatakaensis TaxID=1810916 RepID=UPI003CCD0FF1
MSSENQRVSSNRAAYQDVLGNPTSAPTGVLKERETGERSACLEQARNTSRLAEPERDDAMADRMPPCEGQVEFEPSQTSVAGKNTYPRGKDGMNRLLWERTSQLCDVQAERDRLKDEKSMHLRRLRDVEIRNAELERRLTGAHDRLAKYQELVDTISHMNQGSGDDGC